MGIRPLLRILLGWFSAMLAENVVGTILIVAYALATGGAARLHQITQTGGTALAPYALVLLTGAASPAVWLWVWFYRRRVDKGSFLDLGLRGRGRAVRFAVGWFCGLVAPGLVVAAGLLTRCYLWGGAALNEGAGPETTLGAWIVLLPLPFIVQGSAEELLERGYLQRSLWEWRSGTPHRVAWALLVPSLLFSLSHLANPGFGPIPFVNTVLIGILFACFTLSTGSLWLAIGIHGGWNFGLSVVWSLPVSGVRLMHILPVRIAPGASVLFGGEYGPEGGLAVTLLVIALLSWALPRALDVAAGDGHVSSG
ncbi:MAG TPA: CPBP family intramembrane glutamic endopeptidase [Spirochaetia bacterium]|nr:CPBP family intramembrane glutamic endopeptidase [Spirochaetia bacterium]